jgi:hypothetical protein
MRDNERALCIYTLGNEYVAAELIKRASRLHAAATRVERRRGSSNG